MEGVDILWRPKTGPVNWLVQPFYGNTVNKTTPSDKLSHSNYLDFNHIMGINVTANYSDFTFRAGYARTYLTLRSNSFETNARAALQKICGLRDEIACAQLNALALDDKDASFASAGVTWDNGDYFVTGEAGKRSIDSYVADTISWYISAGARFDKFTPYATFSQLRNESPTQYNGDKGPLGTLTNLISTKLLTQNLMNQHTFSLGTRYDFYDNMALKFQWDRIDTRAIAGQPGTGVGAFTNYTASAFANNSNTVDLFSTTIDFVF
jgi:hypothetical protein